MTGGENLKTQLLKSYRVRVGITQKILAKLLQIDVTTYSKKENGVIEFKASEILILKKTLNLTPIEIDEIFLIAMLSLAQQMLRLFSIVCPNLKNILRKGVE